MTALILAFSTGVLALQALPGLPPWWGVPVIAGLALWPWRYRAVLVAAVFGLALTLARAEWRLADRWPLPQQGQQVVALGHIASLPERSVERDGSSTWRFVFEPLDKKLPDRVRVSVYRSPVVFRGGACWRLALRLKTPHGSSNPGGFDYEGWLFQQGIGATASAKAEQGCELRGFYPVLKLRQKLRERLQAWLPGHPAQALLIAMVMGDDSDVSKDDWRAFRQTGTTHLIAISGFNLAIVAGLVFFLWRWTWPALPSLARRLPAQKAAAIAAGVAATIYALLAGFEPPVTRALIMLLVGLAALFANRLARPFQVLALAWALLLLLDPFAVMAPGTWLSFCAVAAIVYLASGRLHGGAAWRQAVWVQLGLSLLLAPLSFFWFQSSSVIAGAVNLLAVPWFAVLTPLALIAVMLALVWPWAGLPLLRATAEGLEGTRQVFHALALSHNETVFSSAPPAPALLLAALGMLLLLAPRGVPLRWLGLLCLLPLATPPQSAPSAGFTVTALDVGQGLSVLVQTAHHSLLFDAGPASESGFDAGEQVVLPALRRLGLSRIDRLIISHRDTDHAGGAGAIREGLPVHEEQGALAGKPCAAGQSWDWDGVRFNILSGPAQALGENKPSNNGSCVLRVSVAAHAALLAADIEKQAEARLLEQIGPEGLRAELLLAPHHGSHSSSSPDFVAAVNPEAVIFSAGFANSFRHPRPEVVRRYESLGSELYMTGHEGALSVHIDPNTGIGAVSAWRKHWPRYWQAPWLPVPD